MSWPSALRGRDFQQCILEEGFCLELGVIVEEMERRQECRLAIQLKVAYNKDQSKDQRHWPAGFGKTDYVIRE